MAALTKTEKKLEQLEAKDERERAEKKALSLQLHGFMYAGGIGFAEGLAEKQGWTWVSEGWGGVGVELIQGGVGLYLARKKKGKAAEFGQTLATIGIYKFGRNAGNSFELGGLFGE